MTQSTYQPSLDRKFADLENELCTEAHRLSDVLGGASLGLLVGCATVWVVMLLPELEAELRKRWRTAGGTFARKLGGWAGSG